MQATMPVQVSHSSHYQVRQPANLTSANGKLTITDVIYPNGSLLKAQSGAEVIQVAPCGVLLLWNMLMPMGYFKQ